MTVLIEWFRDPGFLVSVCALVVSIWAICTSRKTNREATEIQRRLLNIEEQHEAERRTERRQAALRAEIHQNTAGYRLRIKNKGDAEAWDIKISLDGQQLLDHLAVPQGEEQPNVIGPHSEWSCNLTFSHDCGPPFAIVIIWKDASDMPGKYRSELTL